ncbi:MAG: protein kinase, partial [Acidobacteriota bacterium]
MSLILVVEKDADYRSQLEAALRAGGHEIEAVSSCEAGEHHALQRRPDLVLASGMLPGAPQLLGKFSKRSGGPGAAVIVPAQMAAELSAPQFGADMLLPKPLAPGSLAQVLALLPSTPAAPMPSADPALLPNVGAQLTSEEIFGDVLAEVEADVEKRLVDPPASAPAPATPAGRAPSAPPAAPVSPAAPIPPSSPLAPTAPQPGARVPPAASGAEPAAAPRKRRAAHDDIDRKLEETLSGFFPDKLRAAAAEKPQPPVKPVKARRSAAPSASEIDDLLDKTLSSLELPRTKKSRRDEATPPAPTPPAPPSTAPTPPTPAPAPTPPPIAPGPPVDLPSAAQTMRLDIPSMPAEPGPSAPPAESPGPAPITPAPPAPPTPAWTPDATSEDEFLHTGTFDLPALEPLPDPASGAPPAAAASFSAPTFATPGPIQPPEPPPTFDQELSPTIEIPSSPAAPSMPLDRPEPAAPEPSAFDLPPSAPVELPELPAADGWSVSSYEEQPTPEPPAPASTPFPAMDESAYPVSFDASPELDPAPAIESTGPLADGAFSDSFAAPSSTPAPPEPALPELPAPDADADAASSYPSDFESAFALPTASEESDGGQMAFSPDPTETVEPEDTASLQKTLEGVLQIRNGAAASSKAGIPFGDYRLLERVAVGGMAEVWRAQRRGVEGFQKIVAIKKILSHLTGSKDFVTMFIDEAKLAAQLSHANIIQIYDLGKVEDDYFIAMEFVDGKDLRSIQNQAKDRDEKLPLGLCLMVTAALARALDYAHRKRDFDNRDLGLVHRDVSPQNVLISYEGEIKLCDFGIVKAVAKASSTQMGALKGKLQYMSPEQAWGKEVDARSDIFSLGSVFFELLTGQRLFTGDSEIGVLDAVRDCRVQSPRNIDPQVPVEVEAIVMKALAATPETRYQTAGEMEKDIAAAMEQLRVSVAQSDLADVMARLFGPHESAFPAEPPPAPGAGTPLSESFADPAAEQPPESTEPPESKPRAPQTAADSKVDDTKTSGSRTWLIAAVVLLALAAVVGALVISLRGGDSEPPPPAAVAPAPAPTQLPAATTPAPGEADDSANPAEADGAPPADGDEAADPSPGEAGSTQDAAVEQMILDAVDSQRQKLEEDFEAQKRELEAELQRVR